MTLGIGEAVLLTQNGRQRTQTTVAGSTTNFDVGNLLENLPEGLVEAFTDIVQQFLPFLEKLIPGISQKFNAFAGGGDAAVAAPEAVANYQANTEALGTSAEAVEAVEEVASAGFTNVTAAQLYDATAEADIENGSVSFEIGAEFDVSGQSYTLVSQLDHESGVRAYTLEDPEGGLFTVVPGMDLPENYAELSADIANGADLTSVFTRGSGAEFEADKANILAERGGLLFAGEGEISEQRVALADYLAHVEESFPDGSHIQIGHSFGASLMASIPGTSGYLFAPAGVNQSFDGALDDINARFEITAGASDPVAEILGRSLDVDHVVDTSALSADDQMHGHIRPGAVLPAPAPTG